MAFDAGTAAIMELGGAKPGDRTMVDALAPAADAWKKSGSFADAAKAADAGAKATSDMLPALGRASYLGKRALGHPDGGATAVASGLEPSAANSSIDTPAARPLHGTNRRPGPVRARRPAWRDFPPVPVHRGPEPIGSGGCLMDQRRPGVQFTDAADRQMIRGEKLEGEHHNRRDGR